MLMAGMVGEFPGLEIFLKQQIERLGKERSPHCGTTFKKDILQHFLKLNPGEITDPIRELSLAEKKKYYAQGVLAALALERIGDAPYAVTMLWVGGKDVAINSRKDFSGMITSFCSSSVKEDAWASRVDPQSFRELRESEILYKALHDAAIGLEPPRAALVLGAGVTGGGSSSEQENKEKQENKASSCVIM